MGKSVFRSLTHIPSLADYLARRLFHDHRSDGDLPCRKCGACKLKGALHIPVCHCVSLTQA